MSRADGIPMISALILFAFFQPFSLFLWLYLLLVIGIPGNMSYELKSWIDYWDQYDRFITLLSETKDEQLASEFREVQLYVNGLTDGWHDFQAAFERLLISNRTALTKDQREQAEYLNNTIKNWLRIKWL